MGQFSALLDSKNWLFAGHGDAGQSHAQLYTLIASAERHGLDPQKYLMSVLAKIGQTNLSELKQFLPDVWKAEDRPTDNKNDVNKPRYRD